MLRLLLATLAALALAACGTATQVTSIDEGGLQDEGLVVFSLTQDPGATVGTYTWVYLDYLQKYEHDDPISVTNAGLPIEQPDRVGKLVVLKMKPGRHIITNWIVSNSLQPFRINPRSGSDVLLRFTVKPGEAIYLGNIHASFELRPVGLIIKSQIPAVVDMSVGDRAPDDIAAAESQLPALKGKIEKALLPQGPWGSTRIDRRPILLVPAGPST